MYLFEKRADSLNADDINRLVEHKVQENKSLDYKLELNLRQDNDKKEFLFDITSMANTDGGCLIYGIEESKDQNNQNTGKPEKIAGITIPNYDKLAQQIEDIVKGNTDPSISNVALNHLTVDGKDVLVIGIPKTFGLPAMVTFNNTNKFYRRRNSGKYSVDVYELNQMFLQNQVLKESAEKFRLQRVEKVRAKKFIPNLTIASSFFLHIIPFNFQELFLDLTGVENKLATTMRPMYVRGGWNRMYNSDGFATYNPLAPSSYDLLFRNGIYEAYASELFYIQNGPLGGMFFMEGNGFIKTVLDKIKEALDIFKIFHLEPPFIITFSMHGVHGARIMFNGRPSESQFVTDEFYLPQIVIPTYEADMYKLLKPMFDIIWQSGGLSESPQFIR